MCPRPSVVDISQDVELVYGQPLDEITNGNDEVVGTLGVDNGLNDDLIISLLIASIVAATLL